MKAGFAKLAALLLALYVIAFCGIAFIGFVGPDTGLLSDTAQYDAPKDCTKYPSDPRCRDAK